MKKVVSIILVLAMLFTLCMPAFGANEAAVLSQVDQADVATIKARWKKSLVGDSSIDTTQSHAAAYVKVINNNCQSAFENMSKASGTSPWLGELTASAHLTSCFSQTEKMAKGYAAETSNYYKNSYVLESIEYALNWLLEKYYNEDMAYLDKSNSNDLHWSKSESTGFTGKNDWYDWFIASPRSLVNTLILLEDDLDSTLFENCLKAIEIFVPDSHINDVNRGSNFIYYMKIRIGTTLLREDTTMLKAFLAELVTEFTYVDTAVDDGTDSPSQGFYPDGTYLYHVRHFLNGTYGSEHFELLPEIAALVRDTEFAFDSDTVARLFEIYRNAFEPLIYDGKVTPMATGRAPYGEVHDSSAPRIMKASLSLVTLFDGNSDYNDECVQTKIKIKEFYSDNAKLAALPTIDLMDQAAAIVNDTSITDADHYTGTKIYNNGDKAVHHTNSFMTAISMSSSRVYNYESLHDGYAKGWYVGDGMQYTYMPDDTQYDKSWFLYSDPYKRPGTTVDTQARVAAQITGGKEYLSSKDFVGGVSLGNTGVAAMDLESYHNSDPNPDVKTELNSSGDAPNHTSTLTAKKSWFMFDDEVVSLGTDIDANDGYEVRTILDNRKMARNFVYINGVMISKENVPYSAKHLNFDDKIGYVFPNGEDVTVNVNDNYKTYVEAWISHGVSPDNADYAYITLPGKTSAETAAYAGAPDAVILANTSSVQAVKDKSTNTTGYVFRESGATLNGITAANPCTIIAKDDDGLVTMAVSDPTHKLGSITITLNGTVAVPESKPDNVTFNVANGNTVVVIDSDDYSGESYEFSYYELPSEFSSDKACVKSVNLTAANDSVEADMVVLNPTNAPAVLTIALATYSDDGKKLINVIPKPETVSAMSAYSGSVSLPTADGCIAKLFVLEGLKPLNNADKNNTILNYEQ